MQWELRKNSYDFTREFYVRWNEHDLITLQLDDVDLALLRECDASPLLSDKLLALEMLARRIEQAQESLPQEAQ